MNYEKSRRKNELTFRHYERSLALSPVVACLKATVGAILQPRLWCSSTNSPANQSSFSKLVCSANRFPPKSTDSTFFCLRTSSANSISIFTLPASESVLELGPPSPKLDPSAWNANNDWLSIMWLDGRLIHSILLGEFQAVDYELKRQRTPLAIKWVRWKWNFYHCKFLPMTVRMYYVKGNEWERENILQLQQKRTPSYNSRRKLPRFRRRRQNRPS